VPRRNGVYLCVLVAGATVAWSDTAKATAWAGVQNTNVIFCPSTSPNGCDSLPAGVSFTVTDVVTTETTVRGNGVVSVGSVSFDPSQVYAAINNVTATSSGGGFASVNVSVYMRFTITNNSGYLLPGLFFDVDASPFNPGGWPIGASVTNPKLEQASFNSGSSGGDDLFSDYESGDTSGGGCNQFGNMAYDGVGIKCGLYAPDDTNYLGSIPPLGIGESYVGGVTLSVFVEASSAPVPEPVSASLLGVALTGLAINRRKRRLV
jgi:hypothetical protein